MDLCTLHRHYLAMPNGGAPLTLSRAPWGWQCNNGTTTAGPSFPRKRAAQLALFLAGFRRGGDGRWRAVKVTAPEQETNAEPFYGIRGD